MSANGFGIAVSADPSVRGKGTVSAPVIGNATVPDSQWVKFGTNTEKVMQCQRIHVRELLRFHNIVAATSV